MHILLALDGSEFSQAVCDFVISGQFVQKPDFTLMYVQEPLLIGSILSVLPSALLNEMKEKALTQGQEVVDSIKQRLKAHFPESKIETVVVEGSPKQEIVEFAEKENVDMIILGSHGRSGVERFVLGSVSQSVCAAAPCSVTVVKQKKGS